MIQAERGRTVRARPRVEGSSFVGRRHELAAARRGLSQARLLTLTGTGGVGKTRLAQRVAETLQGTYKDGVEVVELATLEAGHLLEPVVAGALGLREAGPDPMTALVDHLSNKRMLLVLDNCEHLLDDCARFVTRLLRSAPRVRILATSRQTLSVYGEQVLQISSLSVPGSGHPLSHIARHNSVRLFVERAASVAPGFSLDASNAATVARLAQRLLAIALAAVQLRALPLEQLARELDERFEVLATGSPAALPRHQTLRATMDWSFRLCSPAERRLWTRLSMFPGGVDLDGAEAVCSGDGISPAEVIDLMTGLVDKSILVCERWAAGLRYRMLESIRAYGCERLSPAEARTVPTLHRPLPGYLARFYDEIVPDQAERYLLLRQELPNVRVALELCLSEPRLARVGLEMVSGLGVLLAPGRRPHRGPLLVERALELTRTPDSARATALWLDSMLALRQGDLAAAAPRLRECHFLARQPGNEDVLPFAIRTSGVAAFSTGDTQRGLALLEESLALFRAAGDVHGVVLNLYYATAYGSTENPERAVRLGEELLALSEAHHMMVSRGYAQLALGIAVWNLGDYPRADALVKAAELTDEINDRWCLMQCLEVLAWIAGARGEHERAARMLGAAHSLWQAADASPTRLWIHAKWHERCVAQARDALGNRAFAAIFRTGARLGVEGVFTCDVPTCAVKD